MSSNAKSAGAEPLLVIVGPTASGKTELSLRLAEASGAEIVSADSVQVYRGFDIGSGKPSAEERRRAPHHLIDLVDPGDSMDAARWADLARRAIAEIGARGRRAIACGGTFLWVRALIYGLAEAPPADPEIRARLAERAEREGRAALHAELARVDPASSEKLAPNDFVRVSRALEVYELTGVPLSAWQAQHGFSRARLDARLVGIRRTGSELDARIRLRVEHMLAAGWEAEVRALLAAGHADTRPMRSVGYRQVADAVRAGTPVDAEAIVRATRVFARRQRTWLRDQPVHWLDEDELGRVSLEALVSDG